MKILVYFSIICFAMGYQTLLMEKIGWFCSNHHYKFLSILSPSPLPYHRQMINKFINMDLRVRTVKNIDILDNQDFLVMFHSTENIFQDWFTVSHRWIKSVLIVVKQHQLNELLSLISLKNLSLNFYCLVHEENSFVFKEVLKLKTLKKVIVKNADKTEIDLQGIHITTITGEWRPYVNIVNCDQTGKTCAIEGFAVDIMDGAAKLMNFTWNAEISNDWGLTPKSGPYNTSGDWGGVMGNIVLGNYEVSVCYWIQFLDRVNFLDHAMVFKNNPIILLMKPDSEKIDLAFYTRPFERKLWIGIFIFLLILSLAFYASPYLLRSFVLLFWPC